MKKIYVVGNRASKSLSPMIFNYWFKKYNIQASYRYLEFTEKNFHKKIKEVLEKKDTLGLNVTIPFKNKI
ncbi:shikimate dehydrogenase, partial [Pelagibacteraceae bacterium]|nr:shikimate dehydrogenase [Pelagibacteraceae bacterium]